MYTSEDLANAVEKKIFTQESVDEFKKEVINQKNIIPVDEENFKLIGSLNDIFVVIASSLLMFSVLWLTGGENFFSYLLFVGLAWGLSELFVKQKKMALPGIVLLVYFVGGVFAGIVNVFDDDRAVLFAFLAGVFASILHWKRFRVPITVAAGVASVLGFLVSLYLEVFDVRILRILEYIWIFTLISGIAVFLFAMHWDSADRNREGYKSDVAFWLHLLAAPLIVHSLFSQISELGGADGESVLYIIAVLFIYLFLTALSLAVNRRVFMISSLIYALFALASLLNEYGSIDSYEALSGVLMGALLLGISVYWHEAREKILQMLPNTITKYLPNINVQ